MKQAKTIFLFLGILLTSTVLFSGCASIVGGSTYNAHIIINNNHPKARIMYLGETRGYGDAIIKVSRKDANKFSFIIKEDGYEDQTFNYQRRTFRTAAFIGSVLLWTGITSTGIPLPYGPVIDLAFGSVWKPCLYDQGVSQESTKNFKYLINYDSAPIKSDSVANKNALVMSPKDMVYLKNGNIIKGIIIEQVPNVQIKIQTGDGNVFIFPLSEIDKITKENS